MQSTSDFNFKKIGNVDVSELKNLISGLDKNIWSESQIRQRTFDAHRDTETIELMWDIDSLETNQQGEKSKYYSIFDIDGFIQKIKPVYVKNYGNGDFMRILMVNLKKNTYIKPHIDVGDSLTICHRTHIPIITNNFVFFTVDTETKSLKEGEIWEISNQKVHSVRNESDFDRIHLIIDYFNKPDISSKFLI